MYEPDCYCATHLFGIVSSYVIKYVLLIAGIESNPGPQLNNKKNIK